MSELRRQFLITRHLPFSFPKYVVCQKRVGGRHSNQLLNWCFEPSQPLGIISGLKEIFIKRYKVEKTNKAEIRPEEQSEKTESCREN